MITELIEDSRMQKEQTQLFSNKLSLEMQQKLVVFEHEGLKQGLDTSKEASSSLLCLNNPSRALEIIQEIDNDLSVTYGQTLQKDLAKKTQE